eukprot:1178040-Pleurochrysis_carterae.AAC.3
MLARGRQNCHARAKDADASACGCECMLVRVHAGTRVRAILPSPEVHARIRAERARATKARPMRVSAFARADAAATAGRVGGCTEALLARPARRRPRGRPAEARRGKSAGKDHRRKERRVGGEQRRRRAGGALKIQNRQGWVGSVRVEHDRKTKRGVQHGWGFPGERCMGERAGVGQDERLERRGGVRAHARVEAQWTSTTRR